MMDVEHYVKILIDDLKRRAEKDPADGVSRYAAKMLAIYNLYFSMSWEDISEGEKRLKEG